MTDEPVAFRVAAGLLGWGETRAAGRRLERLVLSREKETGRSIAIRKRRHRRTLRRVTMSALLAEWPTLERKRPPPKLRDLDADFQRYLKAIDANVRRQAREESEAAIAEIVQPQLAEIRAETESVQANLNELARRVATSPDRPM